MPRRFSVSVTQHYGQWRCRWTDPTTGERRSRTFPEQAEAENFATETEYRVMQGTYRDPRDAETPFAKLVEQYLESKPMQETTRETAEQRFNHALVRWGSTPIGQIRRADIQRWVTSLATKPQPRGPRMKPDLLAPSTVENIFHYFQTVLRQAHEDGLIPTNECKRVELPQGGKPLRMPTDKEVDLVLEALSDDCYAPAFLASRLGLRAGECWALTREDIDHDNDPPRLYVKKHLVKQRGQRVVKDGTKHHLEGRSVYIVPESGVLPVLAKHMLAYSRSHLIFTRPNGQTMDNQWYNHQWRAAVKATGIKPFRFHDLRSYAVSRFARTRAISLATVAKIMGHTLETMQDRYLYLFEDTVMDEMAASFAHMAEADERRRLAARGS